MKKKKIRILIIDDHPIVCEGLTKSFEQEKNLSVCGVAEDGITALASIEKLKPDVLVVDLSLKGTDGLDLIKNIRDQKYTMPILVLSMYNESIYAERVIRAGAQGYVMKKDSIDVVIAGINEIMAGKLFLKENLKNNIMQKFFDLKDQKSSPLDNFSDRELEVYKYIGQGFSGRNIADKLLISMKTVDSYRLKIKQKLNLKNSTELLQSAIQWVQSNNIF